MRTLAALAASLTMALASVAFATPAPDQTVAYRLEPQLAEGGLSALIVDIRFAGDADGETRLALPDQWASESELWKRVEDLRIEGAVSVAEDGPQTRVIKAAPGAPLHVRYRVVSGYDADPAMGAGNPYKPIVRPTWFQVIGETVFAGPEGDDQRPARFAWGAFPRGWGKASDLEHGTMGRPLTLGDVSESITLGGADVTVARRKVAGATLRIAMRGTWTFKKAEFIDLTDRIIAAQRDFWNDVRDPFLITLMPLAGGDETSTSIGGTGRSDAFALFATASAGGPALRYVLAHENMHTWISRRVGGMSLEQEAADYWLSEGFTDFYTYRILLRSGVWSLEDFTHDLNGMLEAYAASPVREAPNSVIISDFWKDHATTGRLPYQRGLFLAFVWDARLRAATKGGADLDDVMLAMRDRAQQEAKGAVPLRAVRLLPPAYAAKGGGDLAPDIARHVEKGEAVLLPADLFGTCAAIDTVTAPRFDRGWNPEATTAAGNVMTGLRDDSPAHAAGLRNGMQIVKREFGKVGDATVEYGLRVTIDGKEQVFRFMPIGQGTVTRQTVILTPGMDEATRAACVKSMSGA